MADDARVGGLFGQLTGEVATRLVAALREVHRIALRTQEASERPQRYGWGATWPSRFALVVEHLSDLPGMHAVHVPKTTYHLARVSGRLIVPVPLAATLAEVPRAPRLSGPVHGVVSGSVPLAPPDPTLFDDQVPAPPRAWATPVLVGVVSHPGSADLDAVLWGAVEAVDADGEVTWTPRRLALEPDVPRPRRPVHEIRERGPTSR